MAKTLRPKREGRGIKSISVLPMSHVNTHVEKTVFCPCFDTEQSNPDICDSVVLKPFIKEKNKTKPNITKKRKPNSFSGSQMINISACLLLTQRRQPGTVSYENRRKEGKTNEAKIEYMCPFA